MSRHLAEAGGCTSRRPGTSGRHSDATRDTACGRSASFRIARGETLCLVGESGCGKYTITAFALMGLLPRTATRRARSLLFEGEEPRPQRLSRLRGNRMAMVFQEPMTALNPAYTIGNQLIEVPRRHKRSTRGAARNPLAVELLEKAGITAAERTARPISAPAIREGYASA